MSLTADKNYVQTGDTVNVSGVIDNRKGKAKVINIKLHLFDKRWKLSKKNLRRNEALLDTIFY
jgi:hypothetical protein